MYIIDPAIKRDPPRQWALPDRVFFAANQHINPTNVCILLKEVIYRSVSGMPSLRLLLPATLRLKVPVLGGFRGSGATVPGIGSRPFTRQAQLCAAFHG